MLGTLGGISVEASGTIAGQRVESFHSPGLDALETSPLSSSRRSGLLCQFGGHLPGAYASRLLFDCRREVAVAALPGYFPSTSSERLIREGVVETAFRRHYGDVYRFLLRRTGNPHEAEELGQKVFADAAAAEQQLERDRRPLLPWLLAVAQRRWVDELRRPYRQQGSLETLAECLPADERGSASESDLKNVLHGALTNLPSGQREVVLRRLLHGQSFREIAAELDTTEGAVKMRFRRGLELLRERLREEGYAP